MSRLVALVLSVAFGCWQAGAQRQADGTQAGQKTKQITRQQWPQRIGANYLPNPVRVHPKVISGGLPEGDRAFKELQMLGVRTLISVDGVTPDVATAGKYGLRYVHLPHGYDGVPMQRARELAKAVRELDGPIYIHCHHGKHRSPAAASVACVAAGLIPASQAMSVLQIAGTSPHYRGLFESVRETKPVDSASLAALVVEFSESVEVPPLAEAMVAMDSTHERLRLIAQAAWSPPSDHPDLDPAHEALLMREQFTELLRTQGVKAKPPQFRQFLRESEAAARSLENALRNRSADSNESDATGMARISMAKISANCVACHTQYRDVPLSEK